MKKHVHMKRRVKACEGMLLNMPVTPIYIESQLVELKKIFVVN